MKIRYYGHFQQKTGYGRAALDLATALLDRAGRVDLDVIPIGPGSPYIFRPRENPDVVIVHTLPLDCPRVLEIEGLKRGTGPKLVAYTTWEALDTPPEVTGLLCEHFDQVWVPSPANDMAFDKDSGYGGQNYSRTFVIPHCYDQDAERPADRGPSAERFRFYWIGAWTERKNPLGLIRAFAHAFGATPGVELVMHSPGYSLDAFAAALASTGLTREQLPGVTLSNQFLDNAGIARLHATSDCFVTASRGEAWNLPAFDAMLAGRHVISQRGLGSDEFLQETSADLFNGSPSPAHVDVATCQAENGTVSIKTVGAQGLTSRVRWLEPDLCALAEDMRDAFLWRRRTINLAYDPAKRYGYAAVAKLVLDVLS